ncbi:translation initiation factor IF-2-like [Vulpes lagopus]|uniref:translation initiation factor IF-2-like n=1 Tax=Vulpes lagopus TaxID=494514 RepID=UPI001BC90C98|nr:translation initiation factor IF-2-like [Vulpes lagopus]
MDPQMITSVISSNLNSMEMSFNQKKSTKQKMMFLRGSQGGAPVGPASPGPSARVLPSGDSGLRPHLDIGLGAARDRVSPALPRAGGLCGGLCGGSRGRPPLRPGEQASGGRCGGGSGAPRAGRGGVGAPVTAAVTVAPGNAFLAGEGAAPGALGRSDPGSSNRPRSAPCSRAFPSSGRAPGRDGGQRRPWWPSSPLATPPPRRRGPGAAAPGAASEDAARAAPGMRPGRPWVLPPLGGCGPATRQVGHGRPRASQSRGPRPTWMTSGSFQCPLLMKLEILPPDKGEASTITKCRAKKSESTTENQ